MIDIYNPIEFSFIRDKDVSEGIIFSLYIQFIYTTQTHTHTQHIQHMDNTRPMHTYTDFNVILLFFRSAFLFSFFFVPRLQKWWLILLVFSLRFERVPIH